MCRILTVTQKPRLHYTLPPGFFPTKAGHNAFHTNPVLVLMRTRPYILTSSYNSGGSMSEYRYKRQTCLKSLCIVFLFSEH